MSPTEEKVYRKMCDDKGLCFVKSIPSTARHEEWVAFAQHGTADPMWMAMSEFPRFLAKLPFAR